MLGAEKWTSYAPTELPKQHARLHLTFCMACCARQDSWSDVQLLLAINVCLVVLGGWAKGVFIDPLESGAPHRSLWTNTYEVRRAGARQHACIQEMCQVSATWFNTSGQARPEVQVNTAAARIGMTVASHWSDVCACSHEGHS